QTVGPKGMGAWILGRNRGRDERPTASRFQLTSIPNGAPMRIEIHVLQNFAPSNLNRDDTGSPKDAEFGGYRRARISSQCQKRAQRQLFQADNLVSPSHRGHRTKRLLDEVERRLAGKDRTN